MNECDFCNSESEYLYPINDGLWAICKICMQIHYEFVPHALELRKKLEQPGMPSMTLAESYQAWLDSLTPGGEEE